MGPRRASRRPGAGWAERRPAVELARWATESRRESHSRTGTPAAAPTPAKGIPLSDRAARSDQGAPHLSESVVRPASVQNSVRLYTILYVAPELYTELYTGGGVELRGEFTPVPVTARRCCLIDPARVSGHCRSGAPIPPAVFAELCSRGSGPIPLPHPGPILRA